MVNGATLNGASSLQTRRWIKVIVSLGSAGRVAHRAASPETMKAWSDSGQMYRGPNDLGEVVRKRHVIEG